MPTLNISIALGVVIQSVFSSLPTTALTTVADSYYDNNRVQATELNNPFSFPAINSYRIGNGEVLGMSTNAVALSQGQYGQFPIYAFTSEGIWTMNIGTGETLINTIRAVSREVCVNGNSVIGIGGATIFATAKGLFIISGTTVNEIS